MKWLLELSKALAPIVLNWLVKKVPEIIRGYLGPKKVKLERKKMLKRKEFRDKITRQIEIATEKGDHEEVKRLHIALHVFDTTD